MLPRGRLPPSARLGSPSNNGCGLKLVISLLRKNPYPGTTTPLLLTFVLVKLTALPHLSTTDTWSVELTCSTSTWPGPLPGQVVSYGGVAPGATGAFIAVSPMRQRRLSA